MSCARSPAGPYLEASIPCRGLTQREKQALRDRGFTPAEIEFLNGLEEINQMVRESSGNGQRTALGWLTAPA
jgi:hypothetical protein